MIPGWRMPVFQISNVCSIGFESTLYPARFDFLNDIGHFVLRKDRCLERFDVGDIAALNKDAVRFFCLKPGIAHEADHAVDHFPWDA